MDSPIIVVEHLKKYFKVPQKTEGLKASLGALFNRKFKQVKAVDDVSFSINEGEMVGFLGPNGAGKTTTLKMLSGILYPSSGSINVLGYVPQDRKAGYQKLITLVMGQKSQLWWDLPPLDSFLLHKDIYGVPEKQYNETLDELIELLDIKDILNTQVRKLSLGQRMKCELIASLIYRPSILYLDEPTIGLDIVIQKKLRKFFREYNRKYKTTIILTSHYMDDVKEICERIIMINHGQKIYDGQIDDLISTYAKEKYLAIDFENAVPENELLQYGKIVQLNESKVILAVPRDQHAKIAATILEKYNVDNLDIEEIELEDIIMKFFIKS